MARAKIQRWGKGPERLRARKWLMPSRPGRVPARERGLVRAPATPRRPATARDQDPVKALVRARVPVPAMVPALVQALALVRVRVKVRVRPPALVQALARVLVQALVLVLAPAKVLGLATMKARCPA